MHFYCYFITLLSFAWLTQGKDICKKHPSEACPIPDRSLFGFPENAEQLEAKCTGFKPIFECLIDYQENCPTFETPPKRYFEALLKARKKFCVKDSIWFKGVLKHSQCYKIFRDTLPKDFTKKCSEEIEMRPDLAYLNDTDTHPEQFRCYFNVEVVSCILEKLTQDCGKEAKELALHFAKEAGPWNIICADFQEAGMKLMRDLNFTFDPETTEEEFAALINTDV